MNKFDQHGYPPCWHFRPCWPFPPCWQSPLSAPSQDTFLAGLSHQLSAAVSSAGGAGKTCTPPPVHHHPLIPPLLTSLSISPACPYKGHRFVDTIRMLGFLTNCFSFSVSQNIYLYFSLIFFHSLYLEIFIYIPFYIYFYFFIFLFNFLPIFVSQSPSIFLSPSHSISLPLYLYLSVQVWSSLHRFVRNKNPELFMTPTIAVRLG